MVLWKVAVFEYMFFSDFKSCLEENISTVCLSVCGAEHSSSELLMRWTSKEKVTHFTVPLL